MALPSVSLQNLLSHDHSEALKLVEACESVGCFYLEIDDKSKDIFKLAREIFKLQLRLFDMSLESKQQWNLYNLDELMIAGYKSVGLHTGVVRDTRDGFENFLVPLNSILKLDKQQKRWPSQVEEGFPILEDFVTHCQSITGTLLSTLFKPLSKQGDVPFSELHRDNEKSTSAVAMLKYLPASDLGRKQAGHMAHTDVGSLTLLFTTAPGLEVFNYKDNTWLPVSPEPRKIIVNVGDTLSFMTGMRLKSSLHRVTPNQDMVSPRLSLVFFLRPELTARFVDGQGRVWTGEEWHRTKYNIFRASNAEQEKTSLLTGKTGFLGELQEGIEARSSL